jgi:phosphatidate cytidylyltransferase
VRERVVGSVLVVAFGLGPSLVGGPLFAVFMVALGFVGFREFAGMAAAVGADSRLATATGYLVIAAMGLAGLLGASSAALLTATALAVAIPLVRGLSNSITVGGFTGWSLATAGSLYLGVPVFSAVALRSMTGEVGASWFAELISAVALSWHPSAWGAAWVLTVVLATWIGDSAAYLIGRAVGTRKLAPQLSPGKTVEGALGGLAGSTLIGALTFPIFGLGPWWAGAAITAIVGAVGQVGDLSESLLKRQSGIKDSGSLIPGHGGMLDRIDALLFAFPTAFVLASVWKGAMAP